MPSPIELAEAVLGSLMGSIGLTAVALAFVRRPGRDPAAFWFGLFALLYGLRLAGDSMLVQALFAVPPSFWAYYDAISTYAILVPAAFFAESLGGPGAPRWLRGVRWILTVYAAAGIASDLIRGRPQSLNALNAAAVTLLVAFAAAHLVALVRRAGWTHETRVIVAGGMLFGAAAIYESSVGGVFGRWEVEPFAMLGFIAALAYVVGRRALHAVRQVTAMSRELELARQIQASILPRELPRAAGLRLGARYIPMNEVAGDFYDVIATPTGSIGVLVADVTGHGVPAALIASMVKIAFAAEADRIDDPGRVLHGLNRTLCGKFDRAFVTAFCGVFDGDGERLRYASAGHPPALVHRTGGAIDALTEGGLMLAVMPDAAYATGEVALAPGDRVLIVTDGVLEAANPAGEFFGDAELARVLRAGLAADTEAAADALVARVRQWSDPSGQLQDDATLIIVDVGPARQR